MLRPQHFAPLLLVTAHECAVPAPIAVTPALNPLTATGVTLGVVVPSPSWPAELLPQHFTPPVVVSAHVCDPRLPLVSAVTPLASPVTSVAVKRAVVVPSPS